MPPRTMWKGAISYGLVTIPVRVFPGSPKSTLNHTRKNQTLACPKSLGTRNGPRVTSPSPQQSKLATCDCGKVPHAQNTF